MLPMLGNAKHQPARRGVKPANVRCPKERRRADVGLRGPGRDVTSRWTEEVFALRPNRRPRGMPRDAGGATVCRG
jgi:hypothetical protein